MTTHTLESIKALIRANLGSPKRNENAAKALAGEKFTGKDGVVGTILAELSSHGKLQAEMTCTEPGCTELHIREQSDWHQVTKCRTHGAKKAKLTDEQKLANKVAAAKAFLASQGVVG